jgi:membrane fusion protein (multidrug efflux system)
MLAVGAYWAFRTLGVPEEATDNASVDAPVIPLAFRVGGQVAAVRVADNARVKKGDVLIELDSAEARARVLQAEGELAAAEAQAASSDAELKVLAAGAHGGLSMARAQVATSQAQVASADAQVSVSAAQLLRAEAEARHARTELERAQLLRAGTLLSEQELGAAQVAFDAAQAGVEAARAQLAAARDMRLEALSRVREASSVLVMSLPVDAKVEAAQFAARLAHAKVTSAKAALELAQLALAYTTVVAPEDGTVAQLELNPGQLVLAGQRIAELVTDSTYAVANFKETQIARIKPGQPVTVEVDTYPGLKLRGRVESITPATGSRFSLLAPDNSLGNFVKVTQRIPVKVTWEHVPAEVTLRPGMTAEVRVQVGGPP